MQLCVRNSERHPPLAVARKPHNQGRKKQRACMHACVWEGECELTGTTDARFEEAGLGYSHMLSHTHTRQTKKRQAPGGWGSPQERVLAHRGGRNWALCVWEELLLFLLGCLLMVIFAAILLRHSSLLTQTFHMAHFLHLFALHNRPAQSE